MKVYPVVDSSIPLERVDLSNLNKKKYYYLIKRIIDIVGSFFGLILVFPLILVIAILMKIDEPSAPIIFSQIRVGKNKKEFRMFKIRSMCVDAEKKLNDLIEANEIEGAMFKMKNDPRITKIGKFIRKTSLDELPQLWNVLKGDMSLVGPRPPLVSEVNEYTPRDEERLLVKPGCTGLWQVSGRNDLNFDEMVDLDIHYINRCNLFYDIKIILKTIKIILIPSGI